MCFLSGMVREIDAGDDDDDDDETDERISRAFAAGG